MSRVLTLSVNSRHDLQNKVAAIKNVRFLTGLGLKEAKEAVERVVPGRSEMIPLSRTAMEPELTRAVDELRFAGMTAVIGSTNNPARNGIGEGIRKLVTYANMSAQYDIARALIDVLETYCPEPSQKYLDAFEQLDEEDEDESKL